MSDAREHFFCSVVQTARKLGASNIFLYRAGGGRHCRVRVATNPCRYARGIWCNSALATGAGVGAGYFARRLHTALSPRRTIMAGLECLRPKDHHTDPQFCLYAESALSGNYRSSAAFLGWGDGFGSGGHSKSLELTQPGSLAATPNLFR